MTRLKIRCLLVFSITTLFALCVPQSAYAGVPAARYNAVCADIQATTGRQTCSARRSVTHKRLAYRKTQLSAAKHQCYAQSKRVRATRYDDATGYRGDNLADEPLNYAELSKNPSALDFSALGGLPYRAKRWFHYRGHDRAAVKLDVGAGGSRYPDVDLYDGENGLARALHFSDGFVRLTRWPCKTVF